MSERRFVLVDSLRGLAALAVVFYHAAEGGHITALLAAMPAWIAAVFRHGFLGVAVFFVLSGFVIAHSIYADRVTFRFAGRFMLRRAVRLDPPYWFAIALTLGLAALSALVLPGKEFPEVSIDQTVAHLFYLQDILGFAPINVVFWTLCYEVQFYLVYVLMLALARNEPDLPLQGRRTAIMLGSAALISLAWPTGLLAGSPWPGLFPPLWHGFLVGAGAYWAWRNPRITPFFLAYALVLAVAGAMRGDAFTMACAATALVLWAASARGTIYTALGWRWLRFLGAVSYALYLTHNPITGASFRVGYMLTGRTPAWEAFWWVATTAVCVGFAALVWWVIERPSIALARRISLRPSRAPAPPSGAYRTAAGA